MRQQRFAQCCVCGALAPVWLEGSIESCSQHYRLAYKRWQRIIFSSNPQSIQTAGRVKEPAQSLDPIGVDDPLTAFAAVNREEMLSIVAEPLHEYEEEFSNVPI